MTNSPAAWLRRRRWLTTALLCLPLAAGGCAFSSHIAIQFARSATATVREVSRAEQVSNRVRGTTTRDGQLVRIDCSTSIDYDIQEATGATVLLQRYLVHLHTRPLPSGTAYFLNCTGALIVEIPAVASRLRATATSETGRQVTLPLKPHLHSLILAFGRRLQAEQGTQLAVVGWPDSLPDGDYKTELSFTLASGHAFREKALYAASISCGASRYLQPILPVITAMKQLPAFTIQPSASTVQVLLPRIAGAIGTEAHAGATISCGP